MGDSQLPNWEPLLQGEEARQARRVVDAILDELRTPGPATLRCRFRRRTLATLGAIEPWAALLFAYHAEAKGRSDPRLDEILAEGFEHLTETSGLGLYGGWCGWGWAVAHLAPEDADLGALDHTVLAQLQTSPESFRFDLINGLVGFGVYLTERWPAATAETGLRRLLDHFERTAERPEGAFCWRSPMGVWNLGVAHGIPGIVGLLTLLHERGLAPERTGALLAGAVPWLLRQRLSVQSGPAFPRCSGPGAVAEPCRIAWCYGDLGAACVLHRAAVAIDEEALAAEALDLARHAATVPDEESGVVDPGLCHGAAGNAHLFHRLYRRSGDPTFRTAAEHWFRCTLKFHEPGRGIGGFRSLFLSGPDEGWQPDVTFLMGAVGIALALEAAVGSVDPEWDRLLLLS